MVAKVNRIIAQSGLLLGIMLAAVFILPCAARSMPTFIADDETEIFLDHIIRPIFKAANIVYDPNKIFIINDHSLNAFVSDGNYLAIHTGTLLNADNVNELSGIIAHESGHIAGGHIVRQKLKLNQMQSITLASLLAASAAAAVSGRGDAAMAVVLGTQSSMLANLTSYQMQEERSADESAVKYLSAIGQSPAGLKSFMKKIQKNNKLNGQHEFPYFRTHPMNAERQAFFNKALQTSHGTTHSAHDTEYQMIKAKLAAFLLPAAQIRKLYPQQDNSTPARYAQAIAAYRENNLPQALKLLDNLLGEQPQNPFFHELKGQFLFESGQINKACLAYDNALKLKPEMPGIMFGWAQCTMEKPQHQAQLPKIINILNRLQDKRPSLSAWNLLARAYYEAQKPAEALFASAQFSYGLGNLDAARRQIRQAEKAKPSANLQIKLNDLKNKLAATEN